MYSIWQWRRMTFFSKKFPFSRPIFLMTFFYLSIYRSIYRSIDRQIDRQLTHQTHPPPKSPIHIRSYPTYPSNSPNQPLSHRGISLSIDRQTAHSFSQSVVFIIHSFNPSIHQSPCDFLLLSLCLNIWCIIYIYTLYIYIYILLNPIYILYIYPRPHMYILPQHPRG